MKPKRVFGWLLLIIGLVLIFLTLFFTYNIFTGKKLAPEIFSIKEQSLSEDSVDLQDNLEEMIKEQIKTMIPSEVLSGFLNLMAWTILAGILIFGGGKISTIGIKLLKEQ